MMVLFPTWVSPHTETTFDRVLLLLVDRCVFQLLEFRLSVKLLLKHAISCCLSLGVRKKGKKKNNMETNNVLKVLGVITGCLLGSLEHHKEREHGSLLSMKIIEDQKQHKQRERRNTDLDLREFLLEQLDLRGMLAGGDDLISIELGFDGLYFSHDCP